ncbi:S24 family peptidase [Brevundimonas sp.]|uniref:S24 family peptidase n=1 Tax=Brevundimonas sp. TaxID=1871086 RepID=UPI00289D9837|nr:S24 family peptidase [Brevundimonas sp.]
MVAINRERLRQIIAEQNTSARAVSLAVSSNSTLVRDILTGKSKNARGDTMAKIAEHLGVAVEELMTGVDAPVVRTAPELVELPVRGEVRAGAWLLVEDEAPPAETRPAARDPRFPNAAQWLSVVRGDSMNALVRGGRPAGIYDGDYVHCVDAVDVGYLPRTGDVVEVERIRFQGRERELTLKQVEVTNDGILLWPRSLNPRWSHPLEYREEPAEDVEVRIRGWVIQSLRLF